MINLSLLKNSLEPWEKVENAIVYCHANPYISLIAQREHICVFTNAHCMSLGFLCWTSRSIKKNHIPLLTLPSLDPKSKSRTVFRYF